MGDLEKLMSEVNETLNVAKDAALELTRDGAERAAQMLLAHARAAIMAAKSVAIPHHIELQFLDYTLRYPEDCAASDQIDDAQIEQDLRSNDEWIRRYAQSAKDRKEQNVYEPKFLSDNIWMSSENCSDQGLGLFTNYDDFATMRGDYSWYNEEERQREKKRRIGNNSDLP